MSANTKTNKTSDAPAMPEGVQESLAQVEAHERDADPVWAKRIAPGGDLYQEVYIGGETFKAASKEYAETLRKVRAAFMLQGVEDAFTPWAEQVSGLSPATLNTLIRSADVRIASPADSPLQDLSYTILAQLARIDSDKRSDALVQAGGPEGASFSSVKEAVDAIVKAAKPEATAKARREKIGKLATKMADSFHKLTGDIDDPAELAYVGSLLRQGADLQREYKSELVSEALRTLTADAVADLKIKAAEAVAATS